MEAEIPRDAGEVMNKWLPFKARWGALWELKKNARKPPRPDMMNSMGSTSTPRNAPPRIRAHMHANHNLDRARRLTAYRLQAYKGDSSTLRKALHVQKIVGRTMVRNVMIGASWDVIRRSPRPDEHLYPHPDDLLDPRPDDSQRDFRQKVKRN